MGICSCPFAVNGGFGDAGAQAMIPSAVASHESPLNRATSGRAILHMRPASGTGGRTVKGLDEPDLDVGQRLTAARSPVAARATRAGITGEVAAAASVPVRT